MSRVVDQVMAVCVCVSTVPYSVSKRLKPGQCGQKWIMRKMHVAYQEVRGGKKQWSFRKTSISDKRRGQVQNKLSDSVYMT